MVARAHGGTPKLVQAVRLVPSSTRGRRAILKREYGETQSRRLFKVGYGIRARLWHSDRLLEISGTAVSGAVELVIIEVDMTQG